MCNCPKAQNSYLGCGSMCVNRMTFIECGSNCINGENCTNNRIQKRMYFFVHFQIRLPKLKMEHFENKGWGLIATDYIPEDTLVGE